MTETATLPARPRRRWLRRLRRGLLVLVALLLLVWVFRQQLLVPLLRPRLETTIADLLGASRVSIGALHGNWLGNLDAEDIVVEGAEPPLRAIRGLRVAASYSLHTLLGGDLAGLHTATLTAAEVELDLRPATSDTNAAPSVAPDPSHAPEPWRRWLPHGASLHIDRLHVLTSHGERRGPLSALLQPGADERELIADYAGVRVAVRAPAPGTSPTPERLRVTCDAADPGAVLDLFGLGAGVREGTLHAEIGFGWAPLWLQANLDLDDLTHGEQRLAKSRVVLQLDEQRLAIERAALDLPGITVELQEMTLPSPFATAPDLRDLAGRFVVRIDDLAPHAALLPAALQELLPIEGTLTGSAKDGLLHLGSAALRTRGAELVIESGLLPLTTLTTLTSDDWDAAQGSVQFALTFTEFARTLPWLGNTTASGSCAGSLTGSLAEPRWQVRLDLGECRSERGAIGGLRGRLRADATAIVAEELNVLALRTAGFAADAPTNVVVDGSLGLRAGNIDPDSLAVELQLDSMVPAAVLSPLFAAHDLGPGPTGPVTLQLSAHHDGDGIHVDKLNLRSAPESPVEIVIDGDGIVPVHWAGSAAPAPLREGAMELRIRTRLGPAADGVDTPPTVCAGTLRLDADSARLSGFDLTIGPARLHGGIEVARGITSLFAPVTTWSSVPLQLAFELQELDLAALPGVWVDTAGLGGRLNGHVRATGNLQELTPHVLLTLTDGEVRREGLPALTDAQLRLEAKADDAAAKTLSITTSASASLDPQLGIGQAVSFTATIRSDEQGTTLEPSVLRIGDGELTVALASNLRRSHLLLATMDPSRTTLTGAVRLHEFPLEKLPANLLGRLPVRGLVSGEVTLDGMLGPSLGLSVLRTAQLSLWDGELKLDDMPRLERLTAELRGDRHELQLHSLTGVLGAGRFSAQGSLRQPDGLLVESFANAALTLRVDGEDLLLYRGDGAKVRASLHTTATGTPQAIAVRGDVRLGRGSKYVRRISVLPALGSHTGAAVNEGLQLAPLPPAIGDRIDLDVKITTRDPFEVRTHVVDGDIDVAAHLRGSGSAPRLEGTMSMRKGMLRFPGANLTVDSGLLTFTRGQPLFPELLVNATGKRMGIVVTMSITGRYDQPQVQLTSVPALPPQDLIVLLTTGQLPSTLAERGVGEQARFVGGYLAKEVFENYFGSESTERGGSLFDRLTIETGREVSQNGTESVLVEYELLPRFSVQVERDAYEDYNLGLVLRFRFR